MLVAVVVKVAVNVEPEMCYIVRMLTSLLKVKRCSPTCAFLVLLDSAKAREGKHHSTPFLIHVVSPW